MWYITGQINFLYLCYSVVSEVYLSRFIFIYMVTYLGELDRGDRICSIDIYIHICVDKLCFLIVWSIGDVWYTTFEQWDYLHTKIDIDSLQSATHACKIFQTKYKPLNICVCNSSSNAIKIIWGIFIISKHPANAYEPKFRETTRNYFDTDQKIILN